MAQDAEKLAAQAERLRALKKRHITFRQISDYVGVTERQAQRWFAGDGDLSGESLNRLAEFLGTTPEFIEYGERDQGPAPDPFAGSRSAPDPNAEVLERLAAIEQRLDQILGTPQPGDESQPASVEQLVDTARAMITTLETISQKLGQSLGRQDVRSRRARGQSAERPGA